MVSITNPAHVVRRADEAVYAVPEAYRSTSRGFRRWSIVDRDAGSVHMGFGICQMDPGGSIDWHVHSFEESIYLLGGEVVVETLEGAVAMRAGDYGVVPVGAPHAWRNVGSEPVRWADMMAPQPKPGFVGDTFFVPARSVGEPRAVDVRDPCTRSFGHLDDAHMDKELQGQERLAVSASMRTALLVYSGITLKMMVDSDLGATQLTMFMIKYDHDGVNAPHDHPLEEAYLITDGEVDAFFDGTRYRLRAGDAAWAGVGCVHGFNNPNVAPVRWLETQAPQPPARHLYRFARDWEQLRESL
jgi:quercetin dioxygenase-like cupin family protein